MVFTKGPIFLSSTALCEKQEQLCIKYYPSLIPRPCDLGMRLVLTIHSSKLASFPGSSAPEREIEFIRAERAWYFFSRENPQR